MKSDSEEQGFSLFKRHVNEPTSLNFPNERGIENYNPKMPLKDLLAATPEVLREEAKVLFNHCDALIVLLHSSHFD